MVHRLGRCSSVLYRAGFAISRFSFALLGWAVLDSTVPCWNSHVTKTCPLVIYRFYPPLAVDRLANQPPQLGTRPTDIASKNHQTTSFPFQEMPILVPGLCVNPNSSSVTWRYVDILDNLSIARISYFWGRAVQWSTRGKGASRIGEAWVVLLVQFDMLQR